MSFSSGVGQHTGYGGAMGSAYSGLPTTNYDAFNNHLSTQTHGSDDLGFGANEVKTDVDAALPSAGFDVGFDDTYHFGDAFASSHFDGDFHF